ncbi:MAG TPA: FG-GAP-like repeat-containing protein [Candidatus Saccharimonadaceae bacterium]|nr:FG-GAP-like repeat-containing protein [Candidatus Saccharimonadaceae bacterium]
MAALPVHAAEITGAQRLIGARAAATLAARGRASDARVAPPQVERHLADLDRRWRSFPDQLSRGNFNWSRAAHRRAGWKAPLGARAAGRAGAANAAILPADTLHVAILRIDFLTDRDDAASTGDGHFDLSGPDTTLAPIDRAPHNRSFYQAHAEALKRYHEAQSYGRTIVVPEVWPRTPNGAYHVSDMADFGPWYFSPDIYPAAVHMFQTFLSAADSQSKALGDRIPWDKIDRVVLIHAGSDLQSDVRQDTHEDIPSFTLGVADSEIVYMRDVVTPGDSIGVSLASFIPETANQDGFFGAINGVLAHECGHLFYGFFDVYNIETGFPVVGDWSLMDSGNLVGSLVELSDGSEIYATGFLPPSIDPFQRQFTSDLLVPREASYGDTMTILNSERNPDVRRVTLSGDEHLLLENRQSSSGTVEFDQDSLTRVVLGPSLPDKFEYDALLPGGGLLVWHVDESVIPFEFAFPLDTSLRVNPDFGLNTNPNRLGLSVVEADGLGDLGDPGSPYLFGSKYDPFFVGNNTVLSDTTHPNLVTHTGTLPHLRLDILDPPGAAMRVWARRNWQLPGWPVRAEFPTTGPVLLAVDADGDRNLEVCWAGGDEHGADSTGIFCVRMNGQGLFGPDFEFAQLDTRPNPIMAALPTGEYGGDGLPSLGPSLFAITTMPSGPDTLSPGGRVWLIDHFGSPPVGWPAHLPALVTTPPVIAGVYPNAYVFVGCADGKVYGLDLAANIVFTSAALPGPIAGRLAVRGFVTPNGAEGQIAAGDALGDVAAFQGCVGLCVGTIPPTWVTRVGGSGFDPDFVWLDFNGSSAGGAAGLSCASGAPQLVAHDADRLWAFCAEGTAIGGWGHAAPDTLVAALGAADADGDGQPEVLIQTIDSRVGFVNADGYPSPGWPRRTTPEHFPSGGSPLALDVNGDGHAEILAMNASGMLSALGSDGRQAPGFPLGTGVGAMGAPVIADLNRDGALEVIAPDHLGDLFAYSLPTPSFDPVVSSWPMLGGDPGRTSWLPASRTTLAAAPSPGPLEKGSLKVYPNPARRQPVSFAYKLSEPARVDFHILDTSGHEVASFTRDGRQSDNTEIWDPGRLPAGLYLARIHFLASGREHTELRQVALLR